MNESKSMAIMATIYTILLPHIPLHQCLSPPLYSYFVYFKLEKFITTLINRSVFTLFFLSPFVFPLLSSSILFVLVGSNTIRECVYAVCTSKGQGWECPVIFFVLVLCAIKLRKKQAANAREFCISLPIHKQHRKVNKFFAFAFGDSKWKIIGEFRSP